jgi:hypothetical protein
MLKLVFIPFRDWTFRPGCWQKGLRNDAQVVKVAQGEQGAQVAQGQDQLQEQEAEGGKDGTDAKPGSRSGQA